MGLQSGRRTLSGHRTLAPDDFGGGLSPPLVGLVLWVSGDVGLTSAAGKVVSWVNRVGPTPNGNLIALDNFPTDTGPSTGLDTLDGIPGLTFPLPNGDGRQLWLTAGLDSLKDRNGNPFGYGPGNTQPRTWISIHQPRFAAATFNITGGSVGVLSSNPNWEPIFDLEDTSEVDAFYLFSEAWRNPGIAGSQANQGPNTPGGVGGIYNNTPLITEWSSGAFPDIDVWIGGVATALNPTDMPGVAGVGVGSFIYGSAGAGAVGQYRGARYEDLIFDHKLSPTERTQVYTYAANKYPSVSMVIP